MTHPVVGPALFVGSLYALYFTPLFGYLMREHWGHTAMEVHFLLVGSLFYYVIIGVDPSPRRLPPLARFGTMLVTLPFHAFFSIAIMSSATVLAADYWETLERPYSTDLLADQYLGGSISWALGEVPLILVMIALLAQWFRSDQREARRLDRAADRDGDAELAAYNARLQDLATHGKRRDPDA
jgi:putative copper resistance protein D